jgi:hypothetical protein
LEEIIIVNAYLNTRAKTDLCVESINQLKKSGIEIMVCSHYPIPKEVTNIVDYYLYDKNNDPITESSDYWYWKNKSINFRVRNGLASHSFAALSSLRNGLFFSKSLGKKYFHHIEYDCILSDNDIKKLKDVSSMVGDKKGYINTYKMSDVNNGVSMLYSYSNIDYFIDTVSIPHSKEDYLSWVQKNVGGISSEMFLYKKLESHLEDFVVGVRKGDRIELFDDPESKIAYSDKTSDSEMNHIADVTYKKNNKDEVLFVFFNRNTELLSLKVFGNKVTVCHNCIYFIKINPNKSFEYTIVNERVNREETFVLTPKDILENKLDDEYIEFI